MKRLFWITGKGGVGKTVFSLALTHYLQQQGQKVFYISAENTPPITQLKQQHLPYLELPPKKSTELYIEKKFHSKIIAKAITKTPFFDSMFQILPSLSYLMFLGHIVYLLEHDPSLHLVVDLPASGHAQALIEASFLFQKIFKSGAIFEDINNIHNFLYYSNNTEIMLLALPSAMAIEEACELKNALQAKKIPNISIYINSVLSSICPPQQCSSGPFKDKLNQEQQVIDKFKPHIAHHFPFIAQAEQLITDLSSAIYQKEHSK